MREPSGSKRAASARSASGPEGGAADPRARRTGDEGHPKRNQHELPAVAMWHDGEELRWAARHWAANIGVKPTVIQLRQMRTKWGTVSTAGRMTLNTDLLALPRPLGEFVIVHELVHLLAPNHGKVFKLFMHAYLPDWQRREKELQKHSRDTMQPPAKTVAGRKHPPN